MMGWPQYVWLFLVFLNIGYEWARHGQQKIKKYDIWTTLIAASIVFFILFSGGFFSSKACAQVPHKAKQYQRLLTREAHSQWGLHAPIPAFAAQIQQESAWNPKAVSHVGARGLTQFMPSTARWWCKRKGIARKDCLPHNPTWAIRAMVGYDKHLFDRTPKHYSDYDRLWVALRSYNGGLGHWYKEKRATGLRWPSRQQVDAACGKARRSWRHCKENLGYPRRILIRLQPRYEGWGQLWEPDQ